MPRTTKEQREAWRVSADTSNVLIGKQIAGLLADLEEAEGQAQRYREALEKVHRNRNFRVRCDDRLIDLVKEALREDPSHE